MSSIYDLLQLIGSNLWFYGGAFLLVLSVLVFIHEWGHYIIARLCGVRVETFSIGFGKELFGFNDSHGTRWKFSLVPLGGYVKMFGDIDPASAGQADGVEESDGNIRDYTEEEKKEAFFSQPVIKRAAIVFAGPAINFIFAILVLACLYATLGKPITPPVVSAVEIGSAADEAGLKPHDRFITANGKDVERFETIKREVMLSLDTPVQFEIERNGKIIQLTAIPTRIEHEDHFGFMHETGYLGIMGSSSGIDINSVLSVNSIDTKENPTKVRELISNEWGNSFVIELDRGAGEIDTILIQPSEEQNLAWNDPDSAEFNILVMAKKSGEDVLKFGPLAAISEAGKETKKIVFDTLKALGQMIVGTRSAGELGGIIRIGALAGDMAQQGMIALITFTALLSINLGLINLFPIPLLDGGHLVFYALESLKGGPVSEQIQEYAFRLGLVILVAVMVFANLNDLVQLIL